ncbi:unnamed protein product [Brassica oleracea var. botrytis]
METNLRLLRMAARCVSSDVKSRPSSGEIAAEMTWPGQTCRVR